MAGKRLLLAGGGHSHLEVLRRFASRSRRSAPGMALTLVSPTPWSTYSGMLPGAIAGHYRPDELRIALAPLASAANARLVEARVQSVDVAARIAMLDSGERVAFDLVSLDVGSTSAATVAGIEEHAVAVRPIERFLDVWEATLAWAQKHAEGAIAMVGGGAAGVETLLAMQFRLASMPGARPRRWMLVTDQPALLPGHAGGVGRRLDAILEERGVALHFDSSVVAYEAGAIVTRGGRRIAADRVFVATGAAAWPWLAQSGLACDARGFVRVNEHLQSPAHPFVFAAGDCASQDGHPHPKSGLHAVRHGPVLAENLRRFAIGEPLASFSPPRRALALIGTGDERAIVSYGPFAAAGAWAWRWKDRIDRAHVAKYRIAAGAGIEGAAQD